MRTLFLIFIVSEILLNYSNAQNIRPDTKFQNERQSNQIKYTHKINNDFYRPIRIIVDSSYIETYTYDSNGNELTDFSVVWSYGAWINSLRYTSTYDDKGNQLTYLSENWLNGEWTNSDRKTYTYDNEGNMLSYLYEQWTNGAWLSQSRHNYVYDNYGNRITDLNEYLEKGIWKTSERTTFTYDYNLNLLNSLVELWTNGAWVNSSRTTYTYDNYGNQNTYLLEVWLNNGWVNSKKQTYTFDSQNNLLISLLETWSNGAWRNYFRRTYTYDNNGNQLTCVSEYWPYADQVSISRLTYTYDNNNLITGLTEVWLNDEWVNVFRNIAEYDNKGNAVKGEFFKWSNGAWEYNPDRPESFGLHYNNGKDLINVRSGKIIRIEYNLITNLENSRMTFYEYNLSQNYPNPFNPITTISYSVPQMSHVELKMFDLLGREVTTLVNINQNRGKYYVQFNGSSLPSGVYIYTLQAGEFRASRKLLLIK